jgi:hypothetical protein
MQPCVNTQDMVLLRPACSTIRSFSIDGRLMAGIPAGMRGAFYDSHRRCRFAQPPANSWEPSGLPLEYVRHQQPVLAQVLRLPSVYLAAIAFLVPDAEFLLHKPL